MNRKEHVYYQNQQQNPETPELSTGRRKEVSGRSQ